MDAKTIVEDTRAALRDHGRYQQVTEDTGLSYHWVQKFACGKIKSGSVDKVLTLYAYLHRKAA